MAAYNHPRLDTYTSEQGRSLLSRISGVRGWLRREAGWTAGSAAIGMAANILTAKVALTAAPVLLAVAGGIVVSNIATTGFRILREAAQADQKQQVEQGQQKSSTLSLMWKHAKEDNILNKTFVKRVVTGVGISALTMGTIRNFSTISGFFSDLFNSHASHVVAPSTSLALDCNAPQASCGTVDAGHALPQMQTPDVTPVAPVIPVEVPLSPMEQVRELVTGQDQVSKKAQKLIEALLAHPDDAQKIKDVAQVLAHSHDDLAKDLYKQAIDKAVETGQKTAWGQASIDLAYLSYKDDPSSALKMMQDVVNHSKGAIHDIAKEFVDQWKGVHPSTVSPVDVIQNRALEEAAQKAAQKAAEEAAHRAALDAAHHAAEQISAPVEAAVPEFNLAQDALTQKYVHHELAGFIAQTTGVTPDAHVDVLEMARQVSPENPEALLKSLEQNAPQLDHNKIAFSCVSDIPRDFSHPVEVATKCVALKDTMDVGDFGTVRDAHDPSPRGLRHLFKSAASTCAKVAECIDRFVTRDAVPDMTREVRMGLR